MASPGIITRMIETSLSPVVAATVLHCVTGSVDRQQAEQGATEALLFAQRLLQEVDPINLVLDLRGVDFQDLQAHKAWCLGFARNPALQRLCCAGLRMTGNRIARLCASSIALVRLGRPVR